jgi:hypothetical protein
MLFIIISYYLFVQIWCIRICFFSFTAIFIPVAHDYVHNLFFSIKKCFFVVKVLYCQVRWGDGLEEWAEKDLEGDFCCVFEGTILTFVWRWKPRLPGTVDGCLVFILTKYQLGISLEHCHYTSVFCNKGNDNCPLDFYHITENVHCTVTFAQL